MDLDEYLWRRKLKHKELAKETDISSITVRNLRGKRNSPSLVIAMKIVAQSKGVVTYEDLLTDEDRAIYDAWVNSK